MIFYQPIVVILPAVAILVVYLFRRDIIDLVQASLSITLALGLNGLITDIIKLSVGQHKLRYLIFSL